MDDGSMRRRNLEATIEVAAKRVSQRGLQRDGKIKLLDKLFPKKGKLGESPPTFI